MKSASFVGSEFDSGGCTLGDLLIDVKCVEPESMIVVKGEQHQPDLFAFPDAQCAGFKFIFLERHLNFMDPGRRRSLR